MNDLDLNAIYIIPPTSTGPTLEDPRDTIRDLYRRVCERAKRNTELTGTVSGAHWNAMREIMKEMGIEP